MGTIHLPSNRPTLWKLRQRTLRFADRPLLMGILNVTPDSFSDGGRFIDPQAAIEHGRKLATQGARIIDVGGQSTRPASQRVDADEELRRVLPVVKSLCRELHVPVSIDTYHAAVAKEAVAAGAEIINDITALTGDPSMADVAARSGAGVCLMHMLGTPATMQADPQYANVVEDVYSYLAARRDAAVAAGIEAQRIALDPGIGFGKTLEHNLALLKAIGRFHQLGQPILVGHSRKGFIGRLLADMAADRMPATIGVSLAMTLAGVQILRVHDVAATRQAIELFIASSDETGYNK